jgi:small subunit ribosomal protein S1
LTEEQLNQGNATTNVEAAVETPTTRNKKETAPAAGDFDWSMDNAGFGNYDKSQRKELENLYSGSLKSLTQNELVSGYIVAISEREIVVNVGFKSDGIISKNEFKDLADVKVGDTVEVYVENTEDENGQLILSRKRAIQEKAWEHILKAMEEGTILTGLVKDRTKGGLVVDVMGIDAFLPGSQIDVKPIKDYDQYVGKDMEFKIVKVNDVFKNVVISHKALIEDDIEAQKSDILSKCQKNDISVRIM